MPFDAEEMDLIEAIHADPKNDGPRLAYAAWLAEHGEPDHAEFIRLQCQQPYIAIENRNPEKPDRSFGFKYPRNDPDADTRLARILEIFPSIYRGPRYEDQRKLAFYEEHYRGLPLIHVGSEDDTDLPDWLLPMMGHLSRVDLTIQTDNLDDLLTHPIMPKVDKLSIWPVVSWETDSPMDSDFDDFWETNIPILAANPIIDRLTELRPCRCESTGGLLSTHSKLNLAMCEKLIEPRVRVNYNWG